MTLEVLSYHAIAPMKDAVSLARKKIPSAAALQLNSFSFDDFALSDDDTLQVGLPLPYVYIYSAYPLTRTVEHCLSHGWCDYLLIP